MLSLGLVGVRVSIGGLLGVGFWLGPSTGFDRNFLCFKHVPVRTLESTMFTLFTTKRSGCPQMCTKPSVIWIPGPGHTRIWWRGGTTDGV